MRVLLLLLLLSAVSQTKAQGVDADLLIIKNRMDSVQQFSASMKLEVDISFINMPTKFAKMSYA